MHGERMAVSNALSLTENVGVNYKMSSRLYLLFALTCFSFSTVGQTNYFTLTDTVFKVGDVYILDRLYFDFDKWTIRDESTIQMDSVVDFLKRNNGLTIEIGGHTDNRGRAEYSFKLTKKRAESVMEYLVKNGIRKKRLSAVGYEASQPIAPNQFDDGSDNPEGRQLNRRVELKIIALEERKK